MKRPLVLFWCIWLLLAGISFGQTLYWNASGTGVPLGGSGTWNTSLADWTPNNGTTYQAWANSGNKRAIFGGTSGTVTLAAANRAGSLIFNSDGYVLNLSSALTMVNDASFGVPKIVVANDGQTATISGTLAGTAGLSIGGPGTVVLTGRSTFTGGLHIVQGTLKLMAVSGSLPNATTINFGIDNASSGGGGTLIVDNTGATGALSRTFGAVSSGAGDATIETDRVAAQSLTLTLTGAYTRSLRGSTMNFITNGGVNGTQNKIVLNQAAGFIDYATYFGGSTYAWYDSGGYVRGINYGTDAGSVSVASAVTVSSTNYLQTTGAITGQTSATFSTVNLSGASDFTIAASNTVTMDGLLKSGDSAATLSGGTIRSGTGTDLVVRTNLPTDTLTIASTIADSASGASSLTKSGKGTLVLSGNNTFTGATFLGAGVVSVETLPVGSEASPIGEGTLNFSTGTLRYTGTASVTTTHAINVNAGGGLFEATQPGVTITLNSAIYGADQNLMSDNLVLRGSFVFGGTDDNSGLWLTVDSGTTVLAKDSAIFQHAASGVVINSGGVVVLAGTGGDQLDRGKVNVVNGVLDFNGLSEDMDGISGSGTVTNTGTSGGTITVGASTAQTANSRAVFDGVISDGASGKMSLIQSGSGTQILAGANTYTGSTALTRGILQIGNGGTTGSLVSSVYTGQTGVTGTLAFNRAGAYTYSGTISGNGEVLNIGSGTVTLAGANTYTGTTRINVGTVRLGTAGTGTSGPLGTSAAGTFVAGTGAALDLNGITLSGPESLSLIGTGVNGGGALTNSSTTAVSYSGTVTIGTGGATIGGVGNITFTSALATSANALTKAGTNTLSLTANSSRTGSAAVTGGALRLQTATALGTSAVGLTLNGSNLELANNSSTSFAYNTTISADAVITADRTTSGAGSVTHTLGTLSLGAQTLVINRGSLITGSGTGGVIFGAVTLTASGGTFSPSAGTRLTLASVTGAGQSFSVSGAGDTAIGGAITTGTGTLSKSGAGGLTLSGSSNYSGGTLITGGTLTAGNNNALGSGTVSVSGGAVFVVPTGVNIGNSVSLNGGSYNRALGSGADLAGAVNASSNLGGGQRDTIAQIRGGTTSAAASLQSSFSATSGASNDAIRLSDIYTLSGVPVVNIPTGQTDMFVLQLTVAGVTGTSFLGWLDTSTNTWINAVEGNIGGTEFFAGDGAYDPLIDFHLGTYGVDSANHTVWAVVNHNSDFAVVPEPRAWALLTVGACFVLLMRRKRLN